MRTTLLAAATVLLSVAHAQADSLQGHWDVRASGGYIGIVLVDAEGRATWDSPNDNGGRGAKFFGYISQRRTQNVEILFTNRQRVSRVRCVVPVEDTMSCYTVGHDGTHSEPYLLMRVGPGPISLVTPASR